MTIDNWDWLKVATYPLILILLCQTVSAINDSGMIYFFMDEIGVNIRGQNLSDFPTRQVLKDLLVSDTTDENPYTEDYVCTNYAVDLRNNAMSLGYRVQGYLIGGKKEIGEYNTLLAQYFNITLSGESGGGHALCKAYIIDEDLWVTIEPQGDLILNCTIGE